MAQAQRKSAIAKQAAKQATATGENPIVALQSKADTTSVRAARSVGLKTGANYTGQYLYDRFVNDKSENKADVTKMDIVRDMVNVMDANEFGVTVDGMVGCANREYKAAVEAAKAAGNYDSENPTWPVREAQARLRTARNHKTVMQNAFGALKFCADELKAKLGDAPLAYRMIREIGSKLLADKGITWKGEKVVAPADRAAKREQDTETAAMRKVQDANPRQPGETLGQYFTRMEKEVARQMEEIRTADAIKHRASLAEKIRAMCGADLPDVIDMLLSGPEPEAAPASSAPADKNLH